ncbi:hypothetical protein ACHAW5_004231 [Stephanodiscus triporus]|uniref:RNase H type-1 domain-containing protein n=1 Tax=Stephanodiscus triporus TaxID=2934178 RepID=A0ABD3Q8S1_9STRA
MGSLGTSATTSGGNARDEAANRRRRSSSDPHPRPRTTITAVVVDATRRHRHRRATAGKYTTTSLLVGRSDDVGKFDETKKDAVSFVRRPPTRCSSRRAASMVRDSTPDDGLLVITCDASGRGGGSKHDGIASVLRVRHGTASFSPEGTTRRHRRSRGEEDLMDVVARRTVPSRTSSEVAAISLGMKRAMRVVPPSRRRTVLILSDSELALEFYCGSGGGEGGATAIGNNNDDDGADGKRRRDRGQRTRTKTERLREEAHRRCLISLTNETPNGVLFARVRSSSRGVGIASVDRVDAAAVPDDTRDGIGYIDHDVADHLSSIARSFPNVDDGEGGGGIGVLLNAVESLGREDIAWLENSDIVVGRSMSGNDDANHPSSKSSSGGFWQTIDVVGSEMRCNRKKRNQRRIEIIQKFLGSYRNACTPLKK